jgi:hypothetical protein
LVTVRVLRSRAQRLLNWPGLGRFLARCVLHQKDRCLPFRTSALWTWYLPPWQCTASRMVRFCSATPPLGLQAGPHPALIHSSRSSNAWPAYLWPGRSSLEKGQPAILRRDWLVAGDAEPELSLSQGTQLRPALLPLCREHLCQGSVCEDLLVVVRGPEVNSIKERAVQVCPFRVAWLSPLARFHSVAAAAAVRPASWWRVQEFNVFASKVQSAVLSVGCLAAWAAKQAIEKRRRAS